MDIHLILLWMLLTCKYGFLEYHGLTPWLINTTCPKTIKVNLNKKTKLIIIIIINNKIKL